MKAVAIRICVLSLLHAAFSDATSPTCCAQNALSTEQLFQQPSTETSSAKITSPPSFVDSTTRWAFRTISPVTINTPIVRLGDVAVPLDPDMPAWKRLQRSPIGLVPVGGKVMTIDRQRLGQAIQSAEATTRTIEWIGEDRIEVRYAPAESSGNFHNSSNSRSSKPTLRQDTRPYSIGSLRHDVVLAGHNSIDPGEVPNGNPVLIKRLIYWIELAIRRHYPEIAEAHEVTIDTRQTDLVHLQSVTGVDHVALEEQANRSGTHRVEVVGRSKDGPIRGNIEVLLTAHPLAIASVQSVRRGHRFQSSDLTLIPVPESDWDDRFMTQPEALIGMEAKTTIREGQAITRDRIGRPILVQRGDRVEVRVLGGGIKITTNGKANEEGSESDLIEVETIEPRKRLIARVAGPGLVEIVTRPPRVKE